MPGNKLDRLLDMGYKTTITKNRIDGRDDVALYINNEMGGRDIIVAAHSMDDLIEYINENFEELADTAAAYAEAALDNSETLEEINEDAEYWCEDCGSALEILGCGVFGEYTAWCPCCGEYRSLC